METCIHHTYMGGLILYNRWAAVHVHGWVDMYMDGGRWWEKHNHDNSFSFH
jgi:hypothetical protein